MPKSTREKKNPYLEIEGHTFDGFKMLDVKKIIPFFKQVQKNSKHYQEMPEGPKKEELFDLYTKMYYEYYETLLLQKDSVNPAEYLDLFDPHIIFGKVSPDYYENQPKPYKIITKQTPSGTYIKDDTTRLDLPRSGAQAYVPLPPKTLNDKKKLEAYLPNMDEGGGGGGGATGGSKKKRKSKRKNKSKRKSRKKSRKLKKKRSKKRSKK